MVASIAQLEVKTLRRQQTPEEYRIYRAALEWGLMDPVIIASRADFKSEQRWRGHVEPFEHQIKNVITFCRRLPVALFADDVKFGRTISAGLIASELISRSRVSKLLIVCSKLLMSQWQDELRSKFNIPSKIALGKELISTEPDDIGAVITTYQSVYLWLDKIPDDRFEMLVLDDVHKLSSLGRKNQPQQGAVRFLQALQRRRFRYVLMLTARPFQNSLWDIYSLVDLLALARGHANPFGKSDAFARYFIADDPEQARHLKPEAHEQFRSIVYKYISRVGREDVNLSFSNRVVQLHTVEPTVHELEVIQILKEYVGKLDPSTQSSILFALTSSPHALLTQLNTMAHRGAPYEKLAAAVHEIVERMPLSAKLQALKTLVDRLRQQRPQYWRLIIFTGRVETQGRIQTYLEARGISVGVINGSSSSRNKETLAGFRKSRPEINVIIVTDDSPEALNLPINAVVANYDLPWDPTVLERRIAHVRQAESNRAPLNIVHIVLKGTFEEQVVGRLLGTLQVESHVVGNIEALLQVAGYDDEDDASNFANKILQLIVSTLAGEEIESAISQTEQVIADAKVQLEREQEFLDEVLGSMDRVEYVGPQAPNLRPSPHSMDVKKFTQSALESLGASLLPYGDQIDLSERGGGRELIRFEDSAPETSSNAILYAPGSAAFSQLVDKISARGFHNVEDLDHEVEKEAAKVARQWTSEFGATLIGTKLEDVSRGFIGKALLRVRATVAHDSCERLVEVSCEARNHHEAWLGHGALEPLPSVIRDVTALGINPEVLVAAASKDAAIAEFCRFYTERRKQEALSAGTNVNRKRKLEDEFTPHFEMLLVGLTGEVYRQLKLRIRYQWDSSAKYSSMLIIAPYFGAVTQAPPLALCAQTGQMVPEDCLQQCEMTGADVIKHLLVQSDMSGRFAQPEHTFVCHLSKQRVLLDEAELSDVTGQIVARSVLRESALSGKRAEPEYLETCEFTQTEVLQSELNVSDLSGKRYRIDEELRSEVSGKAGHRSEFILCYETGKPLLAEEAESCEVTGHLVLPGVLEKCSVTGLAVLPSELEECAASGKRALKEYLVASSISNARILKKYAMRSAAGKLCAPLEAKRCMWSGRIYHPDDLRTCALTGVQVHSEFVTSGPNPRLRPLSDLLLGGRRSSDASDLWDAIAAKASVALGGGRCRLEAAQASPDGRHVAVCSEVRTLLGLTTQQAGLLYSVNNDAIVGRIALGKRTPNGWADARS